MYTEDDLLPLSGLQHLAFCERQWSLIHVEQAWSENVLTAEGRRLHERTHEAGAECRSGLRVARGLRIRSLRLGIAGQADVVEFRPAQEGAVLPGVEGRWRPFPVEYKRGRPKPGPCDLAQLCAQAICLEEMFGVAVPAGAMFYGTPRRRMDVDFVPALRAKTETLAARMHQLYDACATPAAVYGRRCEKCSLLAQCLPKSAGAGRPVERYLARALEPGED